MKRNEELEREFKLKKIKKILGSYYPEEEIEVMFDFHMCIMERAEKIYHKENEKEASDFLKGYVLAMPRDHVEMLGILFVHTIFKDQLVLPEDLELKNN